MKYLAGFLLFPFSFSSSSSFSSGFRSVRLIFPQGTVSRSRFVSHPPGIRPISRRELIFSSIKSALSIRIAATRFTVHGSRDAVPPPNGMGGKGHESLVERAAYNPRATLPFSLSLSVSSLFTSSSTQCNVSRNRPSFDEETVSSEESRVTNGGGGIHYAPLIPEKYKLIDVRTYK